MQRPSLRDIRKIVSPLVPPLCPLCFVPVEEDQHLCTDCWKDVFFISPPFCHQCGKPLECSDVLTPTCGQCLKEPPYFSQTRSIFQYTNFSKPLVLRLKHGDATYLAPLLAQWMLRHKEIFEGIDLILPVPLHWTRLLKRGFNQAALLSQHMSAHTTIPHNPLILRRKRATPSQGHLSRKGRQRNMQGAFKVSNNNKKEIQNKNILLVDDVMASSSTVNACAKTLLTAGAQEVRVLTACRSHGPQT